MSEDKKAAEGGMVFYPRAYHLDDREPENPRTDYATGVNQQGEEVVLYVHPPREAVYAARNSSTGQTVPTIEEFADDRPGARNACVAIPDNGPAKSEGVLLAEQISEAPDKLKARHTGKKVIVAKWASVLAPRQAFGMMNGNVMPAPVIGHGYMEINFHPRLDAQGEVLTNEWKALRRAAGDTPSPEAQEKLDQLADKIYAIRRKWFVATVVQAEKTVALARPTPAQLREQCQPILEANTEHGMYGGVLLRVRRGDVVDSRLSTRMFMQFQYKEKRPMTFGEVFDGFMKFRGGRLLAALQTEPGLTLDIIPVQRINCGQSGNNRYSENLTHNGKLMKTYVEKRFRSDPTVNLVDANAFLYADVAIRIAEVRRGTGRGNRLVSAMHAFSAPKGNVMTIGDANELKMDFNVDEAAPAASPEPQGKHSSQSVPQPSF